MTEERRTGPITRGQGTLAALTRAGHAFQQALADDLPAMSFLKDRYGLSDDLIQEYGLGVTDRGSWERIGEEDTALLASAGLRRPRGKRLGYGRWNDSELMLPVRDRQGRNVGFIIQPISEPGTPVKESSSTGNSVILRADYAVFGLDQALQAIQLEQPIVIVQSALEALYLAQHDLRGAVAPLTQPLGPRVIETSLKFTSNIVIVCPSSRPLVEKALDATMSSLIDGANVQFAFIPKGLSNCIEHIQFKGIDAFVDMLERSVSTIDLLYRRLISSPELPASGEAQWIIDRGRDFMKRNPSDVVRKEGMKRLKELAGVEPQKTSSISDKPSYSQIALGTAQTTSTVATAPAVPAPVPAKSSIRTMGVTDSAPLVVSKPKTSTTIIETAPPLVPPPWVMELLGSAVYRTQKSAAGRMAPNDEIVSWALSIIDANSGRVTVERLATALKMAVFRGRGLVAGLRKLLNVDGISILCIEESTDTVILDRVRLKQHFNVGG